MARGPCSCARGRGDKRVVTVIVADGGSADATRSIARKCGAKVSAEFLSSQLHASMHAPSLFGCNKKHRTEMRCQSKNEVAAPMRVHSERC